MSARDSIDSAAGSREGAAHGGAASSVDADNPWLGLASFTEETQEYFFGREEEVAELARRVQRRLLTVLFGKSGLGKTSILRAGLVPRLRAQGYLPVYLRIDYGGDSPEPAEQIKQEIQKAVATGERTQTGVASPGESIWEFLHHRDDVLKDASGAKLTPLLIFDQFEELFTLAQSDEFGRTRAAKFIEELSDLIENRPPRALEAKLESDESVAERFDFARSDYRVVIALREDYLAPLEGLKKLMPSLAQNRLRLSPMTGTQALEAVLRPGNRLRPTHPLVSEEVAEAIVRFVAGGSELANAEVEPSLLSLICRELNEQRIAQGRSEISQDLLAGSHETILSNFYERSLADQPDSVRRIIEDDLLTESGYRENVAEESLLKRFQTAGAAADALGKLVNRRLLRIEERLDVRRVELTHDVLTGVVKASRDQRHEREALEATERLLAEQRESENAARRALRRARAVAAGFALLAVLAIAATVAAFFSMQRARRAEQVARQTRTISEQARREADGLLGYLTDKLVDELTTFGRYQTIAELSQREIDYFQHLPTQLKDPETVRSAALALVDHAQAFFFLGDPLISLQDEDEAVALLTQLRRGGDESESTAVDLAGAYTMQGWTLGLEYRGQEAFADATRAVDLLRPLARQAHASVESRRAYITALTLLAWLGQQSRTQPPPNLLAVQAASEALRVAAQLGAEHQRDVTSDAERAAAGAWLSFALAHLGHNPEARRAGEDALAVADRILAQHPQEGEALIAKQSLEDSLRAVAMSELDPNEALRIGAQSVETALELVRVEPKNAIYVLELGFAYTGLGASAWAAGEFHASIADDQKAMSALIEAIEQGRAGHAYDLDNVIDWMTTTALEQAQLGDSAGVGATLAATDPVTSPKALRQLGLAGGNTGVFLHALRSYPAAVLAYERAHFDRARRIARGALAPLRAVRPSGALEIGPMNSALYRLSDIEGHAEYDFGDFSAAAQSERTALQAVKIAMDTSTDTTDNGERETAQVAIWLSMALAREGKRAEAARTIDPVVAMYRGLERRNHGDRFLPLEAAEALYAESLTDDRHRAALLREAAARVGHLIPAIAQLHDTRQWRAWIEAGERRAGGASR
jgi:hypothetical protein